MNVENRVVRERKTVSIMIHLYCNVHHKKTRGLCDQCFQLEQYAQKRIDFCPLIPQKPVYSECVVHCYKTDYREQIRKVMRYSGPRMILYHPWLAITHLVDKALFKPEKQ